MSGVASGSLGHFHSRLSRKGLHLSYMIALARRYRPKRFADLLVQDHVSSVLRGAVARGRVGHGYLLTGPRGVGKTTAARILAMALNCPNRDPSGEPCGVCEECVRVWNGAANLDVVEIDAASNRGVDDARDLRERAMYAASGEGRYKVYIVDEAHMLTREAWNALLKILEEPPPRVVFVFATTEPQKIGATAAPVLSRLQRFDFRRIGPGAIRERLKEVLATENIKAEEDALTLIAQHADGGMRDALSMLDQCLSFGEDTVTAMRVREVLGLPGDELYAEVLGLVAERRPAAVFPLVDRLVNAGADLAEFLAGAGEALRALLMLQLGAEPQGLTETMRGALLRYRDVLGPGDVLRMLKLLSDNEIAIRRSANSRLMVETLLLRWAMLDRIVDLQRVLEGAPAGRPQPERERRSPPPAAPEPVPAPTTAKPPAGSVEFTVEGLRAAWPEVVAAVRERRPFLGEAVATAEPAEVAPPWVTVRVPESGALFVQPLQEHTAQLEQILGQVVGALVRLRVVAGEGGGTGGVEAPKRLSEASIRADRLTRLRGKDPALDTAADALDLEIVE
jgi:DNA polymerase-3 subunit gamma/tau